MTANEALLLKEQGNAQYKNGKYSAAEALYSKAILADPSNHTLYTNRAMARLKLQRWDEVVSDCTRCLELSPNAMKAYFYIAQAQVELRDPDSASEAAKQAYDIAVITKDRSLPAITALVLRCKRQKFDASEKRRLRESSELERTVLALMNKEREAELGGCIEEGERRAVEADWEDKIAQTKETFLKAREKDNPRREVPDWAIDDIGFNFMIDPVITKTGKSYERSSIQEHLSRSQTDPITREPLFPSDLRPNLNLKAACDQFLKENGWAADW